MALLETIVALALLGIISVSFLSGLATTSTARANASERSTAKILAENLMEQVKKQDFASSYSSNISISGDLTGFSHQIVVLPEKNGYMQKITITVSRGSKDIYSLQTYKTDR
jgi:type II secretory pathway pseudopilin PulG